MMQQNWQWLWAAETAERNAASAEAATAEAATAATTAACTVQRAFIKMPSMKMLKQKQDLLLSAACRHRFIQGSSGQSTFLTEASRLPSMLTVARVLLWGFDATCGHLHNSDVVRGASTHSQRNTASFTGTEVATESTAGCCSYS